MKITVPNLIRAAGLSAVIAGAIFTAILPINPPDVFAPVNTSSFILITSLKTAMSIFGLLGITGLYARQVEKTGWLGLAGYLMLTTFFALQMCFSFIEPTILPLLTSMAPAFVESTLAMRSGAVGSMNLGALATVYSLTSILFLFGLLVFGIATFRARILPRWAAALLAASGPLAGIMFGLLPNQLDPLTAIPTGIALVWLGFALLFERRAPAPQVIPGGASSSAVRQEPSKVT
jgi:hypothetical protein